MPSGSPDSWKRPRIVGNAFDRLGGVPRIEDADSGQRLALQIGDLSGGDAAGADEANGPQVLQRAGLADGRKATGTWRIPMALTTAL